MRHRRHNAEVSKLFFTNGALFWKKLDEVYQLVNIEKNTDKNQ